MHLGYVHGKDPYWHSVKNILLLCDYLDHSAIGYWSSNFNLAFFFGKGFLFKNPRNENEFEWSFDPNHEPFPEKEGMANI